MTDTWPTMNKGRPSDAGAWRQPPGQPGPAAPVAPRPGDPAVVDATWLAVPVAPAAPKHAEAPPRSCLQCGGQVDADGYCTSCGAKAPTEREHFEEAPASWVGAVCDRGVRHPRNEDALATAADPAPGSRAVLVVCDGVTTSDASDVAALAAARAARDVLEEGRPLAMSSPASRAAAVAAVFARAAAVANDAVAANTPAGATNPAACTFVAALVVDDVVYAANVGDSRVYWLPDAGQGRILSTDDSLAEANIASGVPRKDAEGAADAHTITRWLGVDAVDVVPNVASLRAPGPGWVLVCSDGLWNYASEPAALNAVLRDALRDAKPLVAPVAPVASGADAVSGADAAGQPGVVAGLPGADPAANVPDATAFGLPGAPADLGLAGGDASVPLGGAPTSSTAGLPTTPATGLPGTPVAGSLGAPTSSGAAGLPGAPAAGLPLGAAAASLPAVPGTLPGAAASPTGPPAGVLSGDAASGPSAFAPAASDSDALPAMGAAAQPVGSPIGPFGVGEASQQPPAHLGGAQPAPAPVAAGGAIAMASGGAHAVTVEIATARIVPEVPPPPAGPAPVDVARALVNWAIAQGGHDNISACLARVGVRPYPARP